MVGTQIVLETAKLSRHTLQMQDMEDMVGMDVLESDGVLCLCLSSLSLVLPGHPGYLLRS